MIRSAATVALALAFTAAGYAQTTPQGLVGSVTGNVYASPTGAFTIEIPVLAELGGSVRDTDRVVTFRDAYGLQITIGAFPQDATQRWQLSTQSVKDYLVSFFTNYVLEDFRSFCPKAYLESAGFSADFMDGSLFTFVLLPGGSMFTDRETFVNPASPPVAKRGNLIFVRNGFTFVISTELSERVTEGSRYSKSADEENQILRVRLLGITKKMQFPKPAPKQP